MATDEVILGKLTDARSLVWLLLDDLSETTAAEDWNLPEIVTQAAAVVAGALYVERAGMDASSLIARLPTAVRTILDRLQRSGLIEGRLRVERGLDIVRGGIH